MHGAIEPFEASHCCLTTVHVVVLCVFFFAASAVAVVVALDSTETNITQHFFVLISVRQYLF